MSVERVAVKQMAETRSGAYGDFLACDAFDVVDHLKKIWFHSSIWAVKIA